jgi:toxin ParE1/3/4
MYEIVVHESADEELIAAAVFYESREIGLGEEFLQELSQNFDRIRAHPFSYSIRFDEYRRFLMSRFPYAVVYRIEDQIVLVYAVAHLRRRPGYWRNRAQT